MIVKIAYKVPVKFDGHDDCRKWRTLTGVCKMSIWGNVVLIYHGYGAGMEEITEHLEEIETIKIIETT